MTINVQQLSSARVDIGTKDDREIFAGDDFDRTYIVAENFDDVTGEITGAADFSGYTASAALFDKITGAKVIDFDAVNLDAEGKVNPVYDDGKGALVLAGIPAGDTQYVYRYELELDFGGAFTHMLFFGNFNVQRKFI